MKKLPFRVLAVVIGLCFTRTAANPSRKSSIFPRSQHQWNDRPLANGSTRYMDMSQRPKMDMSSRFLRALIQSHTKKDHNVKHLDLSNNLISKMPLSPPAPWHAVEELNNLSSKSILSISLGLSGPPSSRLKRHRSHFLRGLPFLKGLILQRNDLSTTPKGLRRLKSLQSLDLPFSRILQLGPKGFQKCLRLGNIYLKGNKIFKIHPEAFKDLKKLQVVDLSKDALTTILPLLTIALEFPHLEGDLADDQWQCAYSIVNFQTFMSEAWQKIWREICNKSVGNEGAHLETPKIRISREAHLPPSTLNHMENLIQREAERPQEGRGMRFSTPREEAVAGSALGKMQARQLTGVRKEDDPPDLALAVCLSVFITFVVAFCLGAFSRPYVDRLWQQRCPSKTPGSADVFSNEGFYENEAARDMPHQERDLRQAPLHPKLYENQSPYWATEPSPPATAILGRPLGNGRQEPSSLQNPAKWDSTGTGSRDGDVLPSGRTPGSPLHRYLSADHHELTSSAPNHIYNNDILKELCYDTAAWEHSLGEGSVGSRASTGQTDGSSIRSGCDVIDLSHTRELAASLPQIPTHVNTHGAGERKERGYPEQSPLEALGPQIKPWKEMQLRTSTGLLGTQQPRLQGASAGDSAFSSEVTHNASGEMDPPALLPTWDPNASPAAEKPVEKEFPFDPHDDMEINYDSDSEEGSLFTFSSESSKDSMDVTKEQASGGENGGASPALSAVSSGERKHNVSPVESLEDSSTFQKILEKYNAQKEDFGNPFISGDDSGLYETHLENASNSSGSQDSLTWFRSLGRRLSCHETPDTSGCDYDMALQYQEGDWHYSPSELRFSNVGISPPSPPYSASDV